jgi:hypothetical protein
MYLILYILILYTVFYLIVNLLFKYNGFFQHIYFRVYSLKYTLDNIILLLC